MKLSGNTAYIEMNAFADWIADARPGMEIVYAQSKDLAWDACHETELRCLRDLAYRCAQSGRCFLFQRVRSPQEFPREFEYLAIAARVPPRLRPSPMRSDGAVLA